MTSGSKEESLFRYCALAYQPRGAAELCLDGQKIIAILVKHEDRKLQVVVRPQWRQIIESDDDLDFVADLLSDLEARAELDPEAVFKQTSFLSVGPVITYAVGDSRSAPEFVELSVDGSGRLLFG